MGRAIAHLEGYSPYPLLPTPLVFHKFVGSACDVANMRRTREKQMLLIQILFLPQIFGCAASQLKSDLLGKPMFTQRPDPRDPNFEYFRCECPSQFYKEVAKYGACYWRNFWSGAPCCMAADTCRDVWAKECGSWVECNHNGLRQYTEQCSQDEGFAFCWPVWNYTNPETHN